MPLEDESAIQKQVKESFSVPDVFSIRSIGTITPSLMRAAVMSGWPFRQPKEKSTFCPYSPHHKAPAELKATGANRRSLDDSSVTANSFFQDKNHASRQISTFSINLLENIAEFPGSYVDSRVITKESPRCTTASNLMPAAQNLYQLDAASDRSVRIGPWISRFRCAALEFTMGRLQLPACGFVRLTASTIPATFRPHAATVK
jgi:hypothetical protein